MELSPDHLRAAARRWDALAADLAEAAAALRAAPYAGPGDAAGEAEQLLDAARAAVTGLGAETARLVDGLLLTAQTVADTDEGAAAALQPDGFR